MKFNMQQTVTRLAVAVCIQTIIAVLLPTPVLAAPGIPVTSEINMVIAASKKQSKPVIDSGKSGARRHPIPEHAGR